jgi:hypothetical protein
MTPAQRPERIGPVAWLEAMLSRHARSAYLRQFGSPTTLGSFCDRVPITTHEALAPWLDRMVAGEPDVLFAGQPCAFELTGGSSGGGKLIAYSVDGLASFQAALAPWLADVVERHAITGSVYLATSPATRPPRQIGALPLGLPDGAYLGERWGRWVADHAAVPLDVARETSVPVWRERTLAALAGAHDLELISVWSPTFLLRLLDELPDPRHIWPRLKLVSCWTAGASRGPAAELQARLPHTHLQPKGLMSTECVVTVPDAHDRAVLNPHGYFEFEREGQGGGEAAGEGAGGRHGDLLQAHQLQSGQAYEVIVTTASGLYRYRTGDLVVCTGFVDAVTPVLEFRGRSGITCDLVGEKLVEAFVQQALDDLPGWSFLTVQPGGAGYTVVTEADMPVDLAAVEARLALNPQYAYAAALGQLAPLVHLPVARLYDRFVDFRLAHGSRLADIKPVALIPSAPWLIPTATGAGADSRSTDDDRRCTRAAQAASRDARSNLARSIGGHE